MKFSVIRQPTANPARSPFRIVERTTGHEVEWVNRFLDRECLRRVTPTTLYSYAYDLLHFIRWWVSVHHTDAVSESALTESTLLEYVRFQSSQQPPFSGSTINQRVAVADRALRAVFPNAPGQVARGFQEAYGDGCPWVWAGHCLHSAAYGSERRSAGSCRYRWTRSHGSGRVSTPRVIWPSWD
jgi:hypothetical protein